MTWISLAEATCHVGTSDDMVMDQAGGMLIGGALVMLFSRMALALMRQRAIKEATAKMEQLVHPRSDDIETKTLMKSDSSPKNVELIN